MSKYLENIKEVFEECAEDNKIRSMKSWKEFMKKLCINRMISKKEMTSVDPKVLIFPMSYEQMLNTLTSYFCPQDLLDIEFQVDCFEEQVNEYRSLTLDYNNQGYEKEDLQTMLKIFTQLENETKNFEKDFKKEINDLMSMNEKYLHHKDQLGNLEIADKSSFEYQDNEGVSIERLFYQKKVRGVHYRNQPVKVLFSYTDGVSRVIGYDQDRDVPLEVIKIPKVFPHTQRLNHLLNTFEAYKELSHSPYFVDYLGYNSTDDPDYNLFFMQLVKQKSLEELVDRSHYRMTIDMVLFKFWAREIFLALRDLLSKCTYSFKIPLSLFNIYVMDNGTRLLFSNIQFNERRGKIVDSQEYIESKLLKNFALLLLKLLNMKNLQELKEETNGEHVEFTTFIETLLDSKTQLKRYLNENTQFRLTFDNLLSHPFFNDYNVEDTDLIELADNFEAVFLKK